MPHGTGKKRKEIDFFTSGSSASLLAVHLQMPYTDEDWLK